MKLEPSRFRATLIVLFAYMIPIITTLAITKNLYSLLAILMMFVSYWWMATEMQDNGVNVADMEKASWLILFLGVMLAFLAYISASPIVLWCSVIMFLVHVTGYKFIWSINRL